MAAQIRIPDVSNHQGPVDWSIVLASGAAGGICKATEGMTYLDPTFAKNWAALGALGAIRGAYHFARPTAGSGEAQADRFLAVVGSWRATDLLVLDLEVGDGDLSSFALTFLDRIRARTGLTPWFYSYGPFIRAHAGARRLAEYPLWLAAYSSRPPTAPPPWTNWQLWQRTDKATIPGIRTPCDESIGALPTAAVEPPPTAAHTETVPIPVHDFEETAVKQTMMHIGPLDGNGNGYGDWQPGLGRDPNIVAVTLLGPSPPDDGYWPQQAKVNLSAQPRGGMARVVVRGGTPGDTVTAFVTVS